MTRPPGLIPADTWPVVPRAMHEAALREIERLAARVRELEQRLEKYEQAKKNNPKG